MMRVLAIGLALWAGPLAAQEDDGGTAASPALRPVARPEVIVPPAVVQQSLRPKARPASIEAAAEEQRVARQRGQICGDVAIQGLVLGTVDGPGACGVTDAVRVRAVAGVTLVPQATMDCRTATALKDWVKDGATAAVGDFGGGISSLRIASHYACRNRNNASGGRLSEHALGRAVDIAAINLRYGSDITVLRGWDSAAHGPILRRMWRAACGPFGTVLGPDANRFHLDHFHFDTARYRSGTYCR
ncbi:extensin-like domain-containing protein [Yoonia vestfoldensis]|uniref:extensin-like domain-containing protein n=1 Tax=Yoonia vestfoldensis TaxID=245188 RepID=UPI00037086E6|nr:extensin family protein [Yoonia vestfoldensis]